MKYIYTEVCDVYGFLKKSLLFTKEDHFCHIRKKIMLLL